MGFGVCIVLLNLNFIWIFGLTVSLTFWVWTKGCLLELSELRHFGLICGCLILLMAGCLRLIVV